ncbi:MAG: carbohydrate binding domain-containing protein [Candidatus Eisenbacteria bacterium]|nr:carbohydrate binding domain-containing protein [Candidatus Eisenbacteria bacterium]
MARPAAADAPGPIGPPILVDTSTTPDFPHVAAYMTLSSDGHQLDSDAMVAKLARFNLAVIPSSPATERLAGRLRQLRTLNPKIVLLAYFPADFMWDGSLYPVGNIYGDCWRMFQSHDWWLHNTSGTPFSFFGHTFDLTNPVVQDSLAAFFQQRVMSSGLWDGLFLDDFCESIWWKQAYAGQSIDLNRDGQPDAQAVFDPIWKTATDSLAAKVRRRIGWQTTFVGNCAYSSKWTTMNGWMREDFPRAGSWTANMFSTSGGYLVNEQKYLAPRFNFIYSTSAPPPAQYDPTNIAFMRYCLASTLLGNGYFMFDPRVDTLLVSDFWYDEYDGGGRGAGYLGQPLGSLYQQIGILSTANVLTNTGFESGFTGWHAYNLGGTWVTDASTHTEGLVSAHGLIPSATAGGSQVHLQQTVTLTSNGTWSATFWAKAAAPRTMWVHVQRVASPYTILCYTPVTLGTAWQQYQVAFNNTAGSVQANIQLQFGQQAVDVWADDVRLQRGTSSVYRRDFHNGTVLVNSSSPSVTLPLGRTYYRLFGDQDPMTNNGQPLTEAVIGGYSGMILVTAAPVYPMGVPAPGDTPPSTLALAALRNPARGPLEFELRLTSAADVEVTVYDLAGRAVAQPHRGSLPAGTRTLNWDGRGAGGARCAAGLYFVRAVARSQAATTVRTTRIALLP